MRVDSAALPALVGVDLGAQGYAVVRVNKVVVREPGPAETVKQERNQYAQWWTAAENLAYYNLLRERFKTQMKVAKPTGKATDATEVQSQ